MYTENQIVRIEEEIEKNGTCANRTLGVSMRPLFKTHRDVVVLQKPEREIRKYDVVLYAGAGHNQYVLHRVVGVRGSTLIIRGDNTFRKEYVERERIIAYLVAFNRKGKRYTIDDFSYKLYSKLWNFIYPIRFVLHIPRVCFGKIKRKIKSKR